MKNYVQSLIQKNPFGKNYIIGGNSASTFNQEDELLFWATAAEIFSREDGPTFSSVVEWIDQLLNVPVHFVYELVDPATLILKRRLLVHENMNDTGTDKTNSLTVLKSKSDDNFLIDEIEQLQNTVSFDSTFLEDGIMHNSVGECLLLPLKYKDQLWGFYGAGPDVSVPEQMIQKINIVQRLLARMIIVIADKDSDSEVAYRNNLTDNLKELEPTRVDVPKIYQYLLDVWCRLSEVDAAAIIREDDGKPNITIHYQVPSEVQINIIKNYKKLGKVDTGVLYSSDGLQESGVRYHQWIPIKRDNWKGGVLLLQKEKKSLPDFDYLTGVVTRMIEYKALTDSMIGVISEFYFKLRRQQEEENPRTRFHTLRVAALADAIGQAMGLSEFESLLLQKTAYLHDIGYLGSMTLDTQKSIGAELEHPYAGGLMLECLSIHADIVNGVKMHHEWVDGSGPLGLKADDICWTGKLLAVAEFIVEYMEEHYDPVGKTGYGDAEHKNMKSELLRRAGKQFDMLLIPITLNVLDQLGSSELLELGVDA